MKVVIQRSLHSEVIVDNNIINEIDNGLVLLVSFREGDNTDTLKKMAKKIANLRIFDDESGAMNKSILDVKGTILSISQFTLYADSTNGNRPSFKNALTYDLAEPLYHEFNDIMNELVETKSGIFGADMLIKIENDGPITIILEY